MRSGARHNRRIDRDTRASQRRAVRGAFRLAAGAIVLGLASYQAFRLADARGWLSVFQIREVRVIGARVAHPNVLVAEAGLMGEELRYWSPLSGYAARVERDPLVESARLERSFPNRLVLAIEERTPIALLKLERLTPVDAAGRVLPVSPFHAGWDAPIMTVEWPNGDVAARGRVRIESVRGLLKWLGQVGRKYPSLYGEISAVELDRRGTVRLKLVHAEGTVVLDRATPIEKLELIDDVLRDLRRKGLSYHYLDLRFDDQIVVQRS